MQPNNNDNNDNNDDDIHWCMRNTQSPHWLGTCDWKLPVPLATSLSVRQPATVSENAGWVSFRNDLTGELTVSRFGSLTIEYIESVASMPGPLITATPSRQRVRQTREFSGFFFFYADVSTKVGGGAPSSVPVVSFSSVLQQVCGENRTAPAAMTLLTRNKYGDKVPTTCT